jgi:hypothetical protein
MYLRRESTLIGRLIWACLPEIIGLKPEPREKLKSDYSLLQSSDFQVEVALLRSTVPGQLSTVSLPLCQSKFVPELSPLQTIQDASN